MSYLMSPGDLSPKEVKAPWVTMSKAPAFLRLSFSTQSRCRWRLVGTNSKERSPFWLLLRRGGPGIRSSMSAKLLPLTFALCSLKKIIIYITYNIRIIFLLPARYREINQDLPSKFLLLTHLLLRCRSSFYHLFSVTRGLRKNCHFWKNSLNTPKTKKT
jgi:hypothetical protein